MPELFRSRSRPDVRPRSLSRSSPRDRGYDSKWDRYSVQFRQKNPFCRVCLEQGRHTLIVDRGVVDHKWPVADGGPMWDPKNHWGLCQSHHDGWKRALETIARETGACHKLITWCDYPSKRPTVRGTL